MLRIQKSISIDSCIWKWPSNSLIYSDAISSRQLGSILCFLNKFNSYLLSHQSLMKLLILDIMNMIYQIEGGWDYRHLTNIEYALDPSCLESYGALVPYSSSSSHPSNSLHQCVIFSTTPPSTLLKDNIHELHHLNVQNMFHESWHTISVWCVDLKTLSLSHERNNKLIFHDIEEVILYGHTYLLKYWKGWLFLFCSIIILVDLIFLHPKIKKIIVKRPTTVVQLSDLPLVNLMN